MTSSPWKYFLCIIWDDIFISDVKLKLCLIFWHSHTGRHFEVATKFLLWVIHSYSIYIPVQQTCRNHELVLACDQVCWWMTDSFSRFCEITVQTDKHECVLKRKANIAIDSKVRCVLVYIIFLYPCWYYRWNIALCGSYLASWLSLYRTGRFVLLSINQERIIEWRSSNHKCTPVSRRYFITTMFSLNIQSST